jgi:hypothetical protein
MLRRVAEVLGATIHVEIQPKKHEEVPMVAEPKSIYKVKGRALSKKGKK